MIESYIRYAEDNSLNNAEILLEEIINYNFKNYQSDIDLCRIIHQKNCKTELAGKWLKTNGNFRGFQKSYYFGPNFDFWHDKLNCFIRTPYGSSGFKNYRLMHTPTEDSFFQVHNKIKNIYPYVISSLYQDDYVICTNIHSPVARSKINFFFKELQDDMIFLKGRPDQHIPIFSCPEIVKNITGKIAQVNSSWYDPFFPKNNEIYINNHMLSWKSGIYFYTCKEYKKHILPTFYVENEKIYNILNFSYPIENDDADIIAMKNLVECECGKVRNEFEFISHSKNAIKNNKDEFVNIEKMANQLKGYYSWLQLFKNEDELKICYSKISEINEDIDFIINEIKPKSYELKEDIGFRIGVNKWPATWSSEGEIIMSKLIYPKTIKVI